MMKCVPDADCAAFYQKDEVRAAFHLARFTSDSEFFHDTFCTVHTVHVACSLTLL